MRRITDCRRPRREPGPQWRSSAASRGAGASEKYFRTGCHFARRRPSIGLLKPMFRRDVMKNVLIAACVAAFATLATGAYAQNDAMSQNGSSMSKDAMGHDAMAKDAMGHDAMAKDGAMKKGAMKKHAMKKDAMSHDAMGKPMSGDKMAPSN
jgi:pentapeptide MXKDX repeat protein